MLNRSVSQFVAPRALRSGAVGHGIPVRYVYLIVGGLALTSLGAPRITAEDWPRWRGPNVNGISTETGWLTAWPKDGPKPLWKAKIGVGFSSVSVSQGQLYTMGNTDETDHVYCFDANSGAELWKFSYPCTAKDPNQRLGTRATPTVDGKRVYTVSRQGHLFCLDTATGKEIWAKHYTNDFGAKVPTWGFSGSPLVEGDLLIVEPGGPGASAVALDKATGKVVWKAGDDPAAYSSPAPFAYQGDRCVAFLNTVGIVGRRLSDGKELWRHPWKTSYDVNAATPIIDGDKVFVSSGYNAGCVLVRFSPQPPEVLWHDKDKKPKEKILRNHVNSCVLWQGYLYGFDESELRCVDWKSGEVKWSERSPGKGSLMVANGKLIVYSERGRIALAEASPTGYKELAGAQVLTDRDTWAVPVLANGKLYCRSLEELVCLDVRGKAAEHSAH